MPRIRPIAQLGHPVLREIARPVETLDQSVQELIEDLFATSEAAQGAGIAAPQVGVSLRVFILSIKPTPRYPEAPLMEPTAVINPEVLRVSEATNKDWEGCLSVPGIRGQVPRPTEIEVRYQDQLGNTIQSTLSGFPARVFLHEFDHLQGLTWLDHVEDNRDIVSEQEFLRFISQERLLR